MRRITPEEVKAAYEKTGLRPVSGDFGDGVTCGCPLVAVFVANGSDRIQAIEFSEGDGYGIGFVCGVDGREPHWMSRQKLDAGYFDGLAIRAVLWPEIKV